MCAEVERHYLFLHAVSLISSERAKVIKSKHSNLLLITEFAQVNIIGQVSPVLVSCVYNLKKTPLGGRWLYRHSQLKHENGFFSKSNGKAFGFELLKGFELLNINRHYLSQEFSLYYMRLASKGTNILYKNMKNYLIFR